MRNNFLLLDVHTDIRMRDFPVTSATKDLLKARASTPIIDGELMHLAANAECYRADLAIDLTEGGDTLLWPRMAYPVYAKSGFVDIQASNKLPLIMEGSFIAAIGPNLQHVNGGSDPAHIGGAWTVGASMVTPFVNTDGRCVYAPFVPAPADGAMLTTTVSRRYMMGFVIGTKSVEGATFYVVQFKIPGTLLSNFA